MRILGSLSVVAALSRGIAGLPSFNGYGSQMSESQYAEGGMYSLPKNYQLGVLGPAQGRLLKNWTRVKKADDYARQLGLQIGFRLTLYLPIEEPLSLDDYGPNVKMEAFNQLMNILSELRPDSLDAMYTSLPPEYLRLSGGPRVTTTKTVVTTSSPAVSQLSGDLPTKGTDRQDPSIDDGSSISR